MDVGRRIFLVCELVLCYNVCKIFSGIFENLLERYDYLVCLVWCGGLNVMCYLVLEIMDLLVFVLV